MRIRIRTSRRHPLAVLGTVIVTLATWGLSACRAVTASPGELSPFVTPTQWLEDTSLPPDPPDPLDTSNQSKLDAIRWWMYNQPECAANGYIAQVNDADTLSVRLLWYGDDPCLQATLAYAASIGINATVDYRSVSLQQTLAAQSIIFANANTYASQGFQLRTVEAISADFDGLVVMGLFTGPLAANPDGTVTPAVQSARQALSDSIAATVGCQIQLTEGDAGPS